MYYTFNKTDSGIQGKAFEMAIKNALNRKNADKVSPCGVADFRYKSKNYDVKQNGTVLRYNESGMYIKGSNRVIYATHIDYTIISETEEEITLAVNLDKTNMFVLDRSEFVAFLRENGMVKVNESRGTVNIQTCYNYKKDAYHGRTGKRIEEWAYDNALDDDILGDIWDGAGA